MSKFSSYYVDFDSTAYPQSLKLIKNPPKGLYIKGDIDSGIMNRKILGVVGSRKISEYSKSALFHLFTNLLVNEITTVSGFMYGVDTEAHKESLNRSIPTIAVLPCGIELIHPTSNYFLYQRILEQGGLIMSEYEGTTAPKKWTYPNRNRIIAGLCDALLVVQAGENSGSLITAHYANEFGKQVLTIPVSIFAGSSVGNLQILHKFARAVYLSRQINTLLGLENTKDAENDLISQLTNEEKLLYISLKDNPANTDVLSSQLNFSSSEISALLTILTIKGLIYEESGFYHARQS
ncbi:DNA protecting protein DprA [candidate division WWE3 bacterium RIFOXYC1_FULL_39_7]|uniref:DNA protecting protein DprA n=1 Tax=candidate division WWE3 bacterium RIFOXYC1_FULL_39_7 TaxID=1802643 RepID=A0A1F4WGX5_UNCKA|nr:MAG: DNA protecting protein DprA [candidate division WWE3 bacterium RIFOXYC1_FULL_39_7]